jgi:type I restriction enzyme S subunit
MTLVAPDHIESGTGRLLKKVTATDQRAISGKYLFVKGDIVYSKIRPYLRKAILADFSGLCSADMYPLKPAKGTSGGYILAVILADHFSRYAQSVSVRSGMPKVNRTELAEYSLAIPSTEVEQEAIAGALSDASALTESLEQLLAKKRHLKQGAMQELLTGKRRLPGFTGKWSNRPLGTVIDSCSSGATPYRGRSDFYKGGIRWITSGELNFNLITETIEHISDDARRLTNLRIHPVGTFLIAITGLEAAGTRGACGVVGAPAATNQSCMAIYPSPQLDAAFLYHYYVLKGNELAFQYCQGTKQQSYTAKLVKLLPIALPPTTKEQTAIAAILSDMGAEIAVLEAKLLKTRQIKQGMMQELLTGRVRLVQPQPRTGARPLTGIKGETKGKSHNWQINEAVIIAILAKQFGTKEFPSPRKRSTKLTYLLHRHAGQDTGRYLKKAAGPYNPAIKYKGPETIAQKNGYVRTYHNGIYEGFVAAENIAQAETYFRDWYGLDALSWLEQFRFRKTDELELLTTVDMAIEELRRAGNAVDLETVKQVIGSDPEWTNKLKRGIFADANISNAIAESALLFPSSA